MTNRDHAGSVDQNPGPVVVTGFAAFDHIFEVDTLPNAGEAALVTARLSDVRGRRGGSGPNVAMVLARHGIHVELITWLGKDTDSFEYLDTLSGAGVGTRGIFQHSGHARASWIFTDRGGRSMSFMGAAEQGFAGLTDIQREITRVAAWLCVTAGPLDAAEQLLAELPDDAKLAWVVKADRGAFSAVLVRSLLTRATVVTFNSQERSFLDEACAGEIGRYVSPECLLVETRGADGATYSFRGMSRACSTRQVATVDSVGAGDVFSGALLGHFLRHPDEPDRSVAAGLAAAFEELAARSTPQDRGHTSETGRSTQ